MPQHRKNGIFRYYSIEEPVLGERYVGRTAYDLSEVIILNLGDAGNETGSGILDLLNTLFSSEMSSDEKKSILGRRFNIAMTKEMESEVQHMCNLSDWVENKGIEKGLARGRVEGLAQGRVEGIAQGRVEGIAQGRAEGRTEGIGLGSLDATIRYYKRGRITREEAAKDLNITVDEFMKKLNGYAGVTV